MQIALATMLTGPSPGEPSYEQNRNERMSEVASLRRRAHMVTDAFNALEGMSCNFTEGAMYSFPQVLGVCGCDDRQWGWRLSNSKRRCSSCRSCMGCVLCASQGLCLFVCSAHSASIHFRVLWAVHMSCCEPLYLSLRCPQTFLPHNIHNSLSQSVP